MNKEELLKIKDEKARTATAARAAWEKALDKAYDAEKAYDKALNASCAAAYAYNLCESTLEIIIDDDPLDHKGVTPEDFIKTYKAKYNGPVQRGLHYKVKIGNQDG